MTGESVRISKMSYTSIGELYLDNEMFNDEASKTIGEPSIGDDAIKILENRRKAKGRLTDKGKAILNEVIRRVGLVYPSSDIKAEWDIHCGCSSCPCSPGYRIKVDTVPYRFDSKERFSVFIERKSVRYSHPRRGGWKLGYRENELLGIVFNDLKVDLL